MFNSDGQLLIIFILRHVLLQLAVVIKSISNESHSEFIGVAVLESVCGQVPPFVIGEQQGKLYRIEATHGIDSDTVFEKCSMAPHQFFRVRRVCQSVQLIRFCLAVLSLMIESLSLQFD